MVGLKFQNRIFRQICDIRLKQLFFFLLELGFIERENHFLKNTEIGCLEYMVSCRGGFKITEFLP